MMKLMAQKGPIEAPRRMQGFTLMELMIVVAVVGILASVAYPAYQESGRRAKRSEARAHLLDAAARLERFYSDNNQYTADMSAAGANIATATENGHYTILVDSVAGTNQTFRISATPSAFADPKCDVLRLLQDGTQEVTGASSATPEDCWAR